MTARSTVRWLALFVGSAGVTGFALFACGSHSNSPSSADASASSGGSSGGPSSGGASGSGSGSSGGSSGGSSSGSSSGATSGRPAGDAGDAGLVLVPGICGTTPCDLKTNTCCLPADAGSLTGAFCIDGSVGDYVCGTSEITYHCLSGADCPDAGDVCCGVFKPDYSAAATVCQQGPCANAQFCSVDSECSGSACTAQSCLGISPLHLCGLVNRPPYDCTKL